MLSPAAPGQAELGISSSCQASTNSVRAPTARSNFKNGGDNFIVYYFVTGRYFEFLSVRAFNISRDIFGRFFGVKFLKHSCDYEIFLSVCYLLVAERQNVSPTYTLMYKHL